MNRNPVIAQYIRILALCSLALLNPGHLFSQSGFSYPDFSNTAGLSFVESAKRVSNYIVLTSQFSQSGAVWRNDPHEAKSGFVSIFRFRITNQVNGGADGIAFVFQSNSNLVHGWPGAAIGYGMIANSVAVEFDTWYNPEAGDPNSNHISVHTRYDQQNNQHHQYSIASTTSIPYLSSGATYTAKITYCNNVIEVFLNDMNNPVLRAPINLSQIFKDNSKCWIGLTSSTGASWESHEILSWEYFNPTIQMNWSGSPCVGKDITVSTSANQPVTGWRIDFGDGTVVSASSANHAYSAPGLYVVTVSASNAHINCGNIVRTDTIVVQEPERLAISHTGSVQLCQGDSIQLSAVGGYSDYHWSTGETTQSVVVRTSGSYWVEGMEPSGCMARSDTFHVEFLDEIKPDITVNGSRVLCEGESVTLEAAPGYATYLWSTGATTRSIVTSSPGTYSVQVVSVAGCSGESDPITVVIASNPIPHVTPSGTLSLCLGEVVSLDAGAGYSRYKWSTGETTRVVTVSTAGKYFVEVQSMDGCPGLSDTVVVVEKPSPIPVITPGPVVYVCDGGSVSLDGGGGWAEYHWSDGSSNRFIVVTSAGTYSLEVVNNEGCRGSTSVEVQLRAGPKPVIEGHLEICQGGSTTLDAGGGYLSYQWSNGSTSQRNTVRLPGDYTVTVTDSNGCLGRATVRVEEGNTILPVIIGPTQLCSGDTLVLDAGSEYVSYQWSTGDHDRFASITKGGTYYVTVTDTNGCNGTGEITITSYPAPTPSISGDNHFCSGGSTVLDAGEGYRLYSWSNGAKSRQIIVVNPGEYRVTVIDANGCQGVASIIVSEQITPKPTIAGQLSFCSGGSTELEVAGDFDSYVWSTGDTTRTISITTSGSYSVIVTDNWGCTGSSSVTVVETVPPSPAIVGATKICRDGSAVLTADKEYASYQWSSGESTKGIVINNAGTYTLTVFDSFGCTGQASAIVSHYDQSPAELTGRLEICEGDTAEITLVSEFLSCIWSTGESTQTIHPTDGGMYAVTITDMNGCVSDTSAIVVVHPLPTKPIIQQYGDILETSMAARYQWYFEGSMLSGAVDRTITGISDGVYAVEVWNQFGCRAISDPFAVQRATATLVLPYLEAAPGDTVEIPIILKTESNLDFSLITQLSGNLISGSSLLVPIGMTDNGWLRGEYRVTPFTVPTAQFQNATPSLKYIATLGDRDRCTLTLEDLKWMDGAVETAIMPGEFRLILCEEGGKRLFDASTSVAIGANTPNPFSATTTISYRLIEAGYSRLDVMDALGRVVSTLASGYMEPGTYHATFESRQLQPGLYFYRLSTPTIQLVRKMLLAR